MKNNKPYLKSALLGLMLALTLISCAKKTASSAANVNVQFANQTASALSQELKGVGALGLIRGISLQSNSLLGVTPDIYEMKLVAMYLVEAIDENQNNVGDMTRIWTSQKCDADLTLCGIGPAAGEYQVDYFDFAKGTSAVNAMLASYERNTAESTLNAGTYHYIRIDFSGATGGQIDTEVPNLKFGASDGHEVRAQVQAITVELPEALILEKNESFTINLAYDLENRFYSSADYQSAPAEVSDSDKWTCDGSSNSVPCIVEAEFLPSVTKN